VHCCTAALLHCCTAALLHCCTAALQEGLLLLLVVVVVVVVVVAVVVAVVAVATGPRPRQPSPPRAQCAMQKPMQNAVVALARRDVRATVGHVVGGCAAVCRQRAEAEARLARRRSTARAVALGEGASRSLFAPCSRHLSAVDAGVTDYYTRLLHTYMKFHIYYDVLNFTFIVYYGMVPPCGTPGAAVWPSAS
jgi:hypothetical protein